MKGCAYPSRPSWGFSLPRKGIRLAWWVIAALFIPLLWACASDDPAAVPSVASVAVLPGSAILSAPGQTRLFEAEVRDDRGRVLGSIPVEWGTSDASVVVVNSQGIATGVAAGQAEVLATAGGMTGRATVTVNQPAACQTVVNLAPGQTQSFATTSSNGCGVVLPAGSPGSRWRIALFRSNTSTQASDTAGSVLEVVRVPSAVAVGGPAPAAPLQDVVAGIPPLPAFITGSARIRRGLEMEERTSRAHMEMRLREERLFRELGPNVEVLPPSPFPGGALGVAAAPSPSRRTFIPYSGQCANPPNARPAFLVGENDLIAVYQDSIQRSTTPASAANVQVLLDYYRDHGKPVIDQYFGGVSDVDGNGRINVLLSPSVASDVAAFVWSGDFFPRTGGGGCPASNEMELIYLNNSLITGLGNATPDYQALGTLVHEAKHVSSLYKRVRHGVRTGSSSPYHAVWVEEGTAEIAAEVSSRRAWASRGGPAVGARLRRQDFQGVGFTRENWGVILRLARTINYLSSQPNSLTTDPDGASSQHSFYGSSWLFHRFLGDAFGGAASPNADATLFRMQNDSLMQPGPGSYSQLSMVGRPFETLLQDYVKALLLNGVSPQRPERDFSTYLLGGAAQGSVTEIFCSPNPVGVFPWPVTESSDQTLICGENGRPELSSPAAPFQSAMFRGPLGPSGVRVHEFVSDGGAGLELRGNINRGGWMMVARLQ